MPIPPSPEAARSAVTTHIRGLKKLPTFGEPTSEMYRLFMQQQEMARSANHTVDRGKRQISVDLGLTMDRFETLFIGKSILDVGCGTGVLSSELARLKKTKVTALDRDPEVLSHVKESKNLQAVLGSGFNIAEAVNGEQYDVVISSFSSYYWSNNENEKRASITSALGSCATDGKAIFVPVIAEPSAREMNRRIVAGAKYSHVDMTEAEVDQARATVLVGDWLDVVGIDTLLDEEERGVIDCTFLASRDNAQHKIMNNRGVMLERYSAIAQLL